MAGRGNSLSYQPLVKAVATGLRGRCGVTCGARIIVAVSGGADSVALLRALAALAPRRGWDLKLVVGHVQHHLRPEAEGDARFVAELAERLELPFKRVDLRPPKRGNVEAWAREARYRALAKMARDADAKLIATAHQADDQLETLLMRMLRGSSVTGLRGIAWRRRAGENTGLRIVRPILGVDRDAIRGFLTAVGQAWREDHTNADATRLRARLRAEVTPVLRAMRPAAPRRAVALADHARDLAALLRHEVRAALPEGTRLHREAARRLPRVVLAGAIREMLIRAGAPPDKVGTRAINSMVSAIRDREGGERTFTAQRVKLILTRDAVEVKRPR